MDQEQFKGYKAYRIYTCAHNEGDYGIYGARSAGKAKTMCMSGLGNAGYNDASYAWIKSCRRAPEYDNLARTLGGCIAWKDGREHWDLELGHWYGGEKRETCEDSQNKERVA